MKFVKVIENIQSILDFKNWKHHPQFFKNEGLARVAIIAFVLGSIFSLHTGFLFLFCLDKMHIMKFGLVQILSPSRSILIFQWIEFVLAVCAFHLAEFFVTAIWNPSVLGAQSFLVNHSKAYTMAMLFSCAEFMIRFVFFSSRNSNFFSMLGLLLVVCGQFIRSLSMITCGESFNHHIQHQKKKSHKLVTDGVYQYLRHPSYFGFFYWSIGTQLLLGNYLSPIAYTIASWMFFNRRIPFEEQTLTKLFPKEYPIYMNKTWIGIPFMTSIAILYEKKKGIKEGK